MHPAPAALPPLRMEPAWPHGPPRRHGKVASLRPCVVYVGDITGRPGVRPVEDRRVVPVTRETFATCMKEARVDLAGNGAAERSWRALALLVAAAGDGCDVAFVDVSQSDLIADSEDSPDVARSGVARLIDRYNHGGMWTRTLVAVDACLDPRRSGDRRALTFLGGTGRRTGVPFVTGMAPAAFTADEDPSHAAWRATPDAGWVALTMGDLRGVDGAAVPAPAVVAALVLDGCGRLGWSGPLAGARVAHVLGNAALEEVVPPSTARARGCVAFARDAAGVELAVDATCLRSDDAARVPLTSALLLGHVGHHLLDVDNRAPGLRRVPPAEVQAHLQLTLRGRFADVEGLKIEVRDVTVADHEANARLVVTVASERGPVTVTDQVRIRRA